jgi:hypothetical protein
MRYVGGSEAAPQYLGHPNIQHTVRAADLVANRFTDFWRN